MNTKEKKLASSMLDMASYEFGNHGCNDVNDSVYKDWTLEERRQFIKEFHEYNGDIEEYNENILHLPDFAIMRFLSYKLKNDK
jgi:hypothetical protein